MPITKKNLFIQNIHKKKGNQPLGWAIILVLVIVLMGIVLPVIQRAVTDSNEPVVSEVSDVMDTSESNKIINHKIQD